MLKRTLIWGTLGTAVLAAAGGTYFVLKPPVSAPPPVIRVDMSPARIQRGKYLFENVADCEGCHSERDFSRFGGPVVPGGRGKGAVFPREMGLPGTIVAPNITPDPETGIGAWTDGEKIRAIRDGVSRDGRALFPLMPYPNFRSMSDEDVESLVAYMNTLPPVRNPLPRSKVNFPVSVFIKKVPQPAGTVPNPDRSDSVKHGEYLATLGSCAACHTPEESGKPVENLRLAGGNTFRFPDATVVSANITPDRETGIGEWSEEYFLSRFRQYRDYTENGSPHVGPASFTIMPWLGLSRLSDDDLRAIFRYLKSQPAIKNEVETHPGYSDAKR